MTGRHVQAYLRILTEIVYNREHTGSHAPLEKNRVFYRRTQREYEVKQDEKAVESDIGSKLYRHADDCLPERTHIGTGEFFPEPAEGLCLSAGPGKCAGL